MLLGDVFTNLRAALDHAMWVAVDRHSGPPERAEDVQFPIARLAAGMKTPRKKLQPLVAPTLWERVEQVQPHHLDDPQRHELETLRWGSNVDKHRFVHVAARSVVDVGPAIVKPDDHDIEVVDDWRLPGLAEIGDVVASVTLRRSTDSQGMALGATLAHTFVLQVGETPPAWAPLDVVMDAITNYVLALLGAFTDLLGEVAPDQSELERGLEHAEVAPEFGGRVVHWHDSPSRS